MTRRPNIELFQHGAAHSRKASAGPHWENESSGYSVIWSASSLAKFIRHPTTAIGQLTFGSRDRPVSRVGNRHRPPLQGRMALLAAAVAAFALAARAEIPSWLQWLPASSAAANILYRAVP